MADQGSLATQYIEFVAKGLDDVKNAMEAVRLGLEQIEEMTEGARGALERIGSGAGAAIAEVEAAAGRMRRSLDMTAEIDRTRQALEQLKEELAGIAAGGSSATATGLQGVRQGLDLSTDGKAAGASLAEGMASGLREASSSISEAARSIVTDYLINPVKQILGIASPSKVFAQIGRWIVDGLAMGLSGAGAVLQHFGRQVSSTVGAVGQGMQEGFFRMTLAANLVSAAIERTTGSLMGWIKQGLQGTAQGEMIQRQMQLISREVASIFLPVINKVIDALQSVFTWFRRLSGAQQDALMHWAQAGAAMLVVSRLFPMLLGGVVNLATGLLTVGIPAVVSFVTTIVTGAMTASTALDIATAGLTLLLKGIALVASAAATIGVGFAVGTESGRSALRELWNALRPIQDAFSGLWQQLSPVFEQIGRAVGDTLVAVFSDLANVIQDNLPGIRDFFVGLVPVLRDALPTAIRLTIAAILTLATALAAPVAAGLGLIQMWRDLTDAARRWAASTLDAVARVIDALQGLARLAPGSFGLAFGRGGSALAEVLRNNARELREAIGAGRATFPLGPEKERDGRGRRDVTMAGGNFEQVQDLWRRLQTEALKTTTKSEETRELEKVNGNLAQILGALVGRAAGSGIAPAGGAAGAALGESVAALLGRIVPQLLE